VTTDLKDSDGVKSFIDKNDVAIVYFGHGESDKEY